MLQTIKLDGNWNIFKLAAGSGTPSPFETLLCDVCCSPRVLHWYCLPLSLDMLVCVGAFLRLDTEPHAWSRAARIQSCAMQQNRTWNGTRTQSYHEAATDDVSTGTIASPGTCVDDGASIQSHKHTRSGAHDNCWS